MTNIIVSLKAGQTIKINGKKFTVDADAVQAKHSILVGITGARGGDKVLCWYPEHNTVKYFSMSAMAREIVITSIEV